MVKREELVGKSQQEIQEMLEQDVQKYIVEVTELSDEAEVLTKEEEIMALMNENDEYMKGIIYNINDSCEFDGTVYNAETVCKYVAEFVETNEVEWSYTLGLYELSKLWRKNPSTIQYHAYDSTLRILGGLKYKGREQWKKILIINDFLGGCHVEYVRDTSYMIYLSNLHNVVIDALKKFNPDVEEVQTNEV